MYKISHITEGNNAFPPYIIPYRYLAKIIAEIPLGTK